MGKWTEKTKFGSISGQKKRETSKKIKFCLVIEQKISTFASLFKARGVAQSG